MKPPSDLEQLDGHACFRPAGNVSFDEAIGVVSQAILLATHKGVERLLVDTTNLSGFLPPTRWERIFMAEQWAYNARGLHLAVVARPELIDPLHFGVMVARSRGLFANVFTSEQKATEWLLHPHPK